jgi:glyoxylase-like metal-dependent hydrolase (beta-lactamase superfamily II)
MIMTYFVDGGPVWGTSHMFYIEGPAKHIIVDASSRYEVEVKRLPPGFKAEPVMSPEDALASIGLKPKDIDVVILTHLHQDHVSNISTFTNAEIYVQEDELNFARAPHPFWSVMYPKENVEKVMRMKLRVIRGDYQIDESIKILKTPGHTPGTQSVQVETSAGPAIIAGFCSIEENFEPPAPMKAIGIEVIPPGILTDLIQAYDSALKIKKQAKIIIPSHGNRLPKKIP